jgi:geranylgeranyl reductase family protein
LFFLTDCEKKEESMKDMYDVAVVGAGPGGSAAAYYLAKGGLDVLLLDKFSFPRDKTCGDALTPRALRVLNEMGILDELLRVGYRLDRIELIAPKGHSVAAPVPKKDGRTDYVLIVPRLILDHIILQRSVSSGVHFESPVRVNGIERDVTGVIIKGEYLGRAVSYNARMVIVATGANIKLLLQMGLLKKPPLMMLCARAYFEGMRDVSEEVQCHFDGVPLPGYGWVFPLSDSSANIGAGFFRSGLTARWMPATAREAFDTFIQTPLLQNVLRGAQRAGPIKGYPLRVDFASAPTFSDRVMLVGEAAGLVNPVTGEGIDYALESAKIAAGHLLSMFAAGDLSDEHLKAYDQSLRQHYQGLFVLCNRLRFVYLNPLILNRVVTSAAHDQDLMRIFMNIVLENHNVYEGLTPRTMLKVVFG